MVIIKLLKNLQNHHIQFDIFSVVAKVLETEGYLILFTISKSC